MYFKQPITFHKCKIVIMIKSNVVNENFRLLQKESKYVLLGKGNCRQSDGTAGLEHSIGFWDLKPHSDGDNAIKAIERCLKLCNKYKWCYAAELHIKDKESVDENNWNRYAGTPSCTLVTDRPTFEESYGPNQGFSKKEDVNIDGILYFRSCADRPRGCVRGDGWAMDWGGGKLREDSSFFCFKKEGGY